MQKNIFVSFHHYIFMRMGMDTCQYFLKFSISVLRSTKYLTNLLKRADHGEILFGGLYLIQFYKDFGDRDAVCIHEIVFISKFQLSQFIAVRWATFADA